MISMFHLHFSLILLLKLITPFLLMLLSGFYIFWDKTDYLASLCIILVICKERKLLCIMYLLNSISFDDSALAKIDWQILKSSSQPLARCIEETIDRGDEGVPALKPMPLLVQVSVCLRTPWNIEQFIIYINLNV